MIPTPPPELQRRIDAELAREAGELRRREIAMTDKTSDGHADQSFRLEIAFQAAGGAGVILRTDNDPGLPKLPARHLARGFALAITELWQRARDLGCLGLIEQQWCEDAGPGAPGVVEEDTDKLCSRCGSTFLTAGTCDNCGAELWSTQS